MLNEIASCVIASILVTLLFSMACNTIAVVCYLLSVIDISLVKPGLLSSIYLFCIFIITSVIFSLFIEE